jgi:hypothetical protein
VTTTARPWLAGEDDGLRREIGGKDDAGGQVQDARYHGNRKNQPKLGNTLLVGESSRLLQY